MRSGLVIAVALSIAGFGAENVNYDSARQGQLPPGWSAVASHKWEVRTDKTAPSHPNILQGISVSQGTSNVSLESGPPVAVFDKIVCRDGDLSVKFRLAEGQRGNAAGIVWRYRDAGNYYLLRVSADDKTIELVRVRNGVTEVIPPVAGKRQAVPLDIRPGQWHIVKVIFRGPSIRVFFGNRSLFTAQDAGNLVPGKTGLWAKGSTGASFDDFRIDKKG